MIDKYITKDGKTLRYGYTTGSCATAAAKAATHMLLSGENVNVVNILTPMGIELTLDVLEISITENTVSCAIKKDSGDDPDVTNGMLIYAKVEKTEGAKIEIDGGEGIGRVTKPGLDQAVGMAAINSIPRRTIEEEVLKVCDKFSYNGGIKVIIYAPMGKELAKRTFNERLGIVGGLSILGTTGIVEPMSDKAIIDTIKTEINMRTANADESLVITPGNYGKQFIKSIDKIEDEKVVKCSNFIGECLDYALEKGVKEITLIGHIGKFVKLASNMFNTHSRYGDSRAEVFAAWAGANGAKEDTIKAILNSATTDEMIAVTEKAGLKEDVLKSIMSRIIYNVDKRVMGKMRVKVIIFSLKYGELAFGENSEEV